MSEDRTTAERKAAWAVLLDTWRTHDLPVPDVISVAAYGIAAVRLPNNERGQVDAWAAALGVGRVGVTKSAGAYRNPGTDSPLLPDWTVDAVCHLDSDDPDKMWSGLVAPSPLTAALSSTAAHLTATATLTPDSPDRPADLPPYVTVEVVDQWADESTVSFAVNEAVLRVVVGHSPFGGPATPAWLADVPTGKRVTARLAFVTEPVDGVMVAVWSDWVEPADDGCSPRWGNDQTEWVIGDNTCVLGQAYNETPADAVVRHNAWLASVPDRPTGDLGPVTAPAVPRPYSPRPHSIVAGFGGAFCEPCRTAPADYRCQDLTCSCRCRAVDLAAVLYPDAAPAVQVAVSPERLAEILTALNIESGTDEDAFIVALPELGEVTGRNEAYDITRFTLRGGIHIVWSEDAANWGVLRTEITTERVAEILTWLNGPLVVTDENIEALPEFGRITKRHGYGDSIREFKLNDNTRLGHDPMTSDWEVR